MYVCIPKELHELNNNTLKQEKVGTERKREHLEEELRRSQSRTFNLEIFKSKEMKCRETQTQG